MSTEAGAGSPPSRTATAKPSEAQAFRFWLKLGMISFGGPAGQIAIMHDELVERRRWISERRFLHALNFCMALPGPEAQQLASYIGYSMYGVRGAITAGGLFVLPSFVLLCVMSAIYVEYGEVAAVAGVVRGLGAAVIALVAAAVIRVGGRVIHTPAALGLAVVAFALIVAGVPFPIIVALAALAGVPGRHARPGLLGASSEHGGRGRARETAAGEGSAPPLREDAPRSGSCPWPCFLPPAGSSPSWPASSPSPRSSPSAAPTRCSRSSATAAVDRFGWLTPTTWSPASRWASRRRGR